MMSTASENSGPTPKHLLPFGFGDVGTFFADMPKRSAPQTRACDACHRRKIQCFFPHINGPCEWCTHRKLDCTFNREKPPKKPRGSVDQSEVYKLSQRIEQLEGALAQASPSRECTHWTLTSAEDPSIHSSPSGRERAGISEGPFDNSTSIPAQTPINSHGSPTEERLAKLKLRANQLGPNWFFNSIPICSEAGRRWMAKRTNQTVSLDDFCIPITEPSASSSLEPFCLSDFCQLPDESAARETLSVYFRSSFRLAFPILDQVLFEKTIETAYESGYKTPYSHEQLSAKACILAAIAIVSCLNPSRQIPLPVDADTCAAKANFLSMHITGNVSLATLQTIILLQLRYMFNGHWQKSAVLNSMACHTLFSLGGHIHQESLLSGNELGQKERETYHTRELFWLSYMLDKDLSLHTGNPPLLIDAYCDLSPPENYKDHYEYLPGTQEPCQAGNQTFEHCTPHFPGDPHLSHLKEKVYLQLFSAKALKNSNNQLLLHIRQLDDEIERWRLSIPINFRPALFVSQSSSLNTIDETTPHFIRLISLQLEYHHLMTIIHTTVRKCTPDAGDGYQDLHDVVHSSFDLSLEASRSTLWCIRVLCTKDTEESVRLIVSYLPTAAMSLFLNIIIHPLDPPAQLDLETLISVANAVRNTPVLNSTRGKRSHLRDISDFVMRLVWLGTCAVTKAARENRT